MTATGTQTVQIEISRLIPTPDNPRRIDTASPALAELAASIKARGQLQAGIARPHPTEKGKYDIRAGARRWHACQIPEPKKLGQGTACQPRQGLQSREAGQRGVRTGKPAGGRPARPNASREFPAASAGKLHAVVVGSV